jgi:hypothetical protein
MIRAELTISKPIAGVHVVNATMPPWDREKEAFVAGWGRCGEKTESQRHLLTADETHRGQKSRPQALKRDRIRKLNGATEVMPFPFRSEV